FLDTGTTHCIFRALRVLHDKQVHDWGPAVGTRSASVCQVPREFAERILVRRRVVLTKRWARNSSNSHESERRKSHARLGEGMNVSDQLFVHDDKIKTRDVHFVKYLSPPAVRSSHVSPQPYT